MIYTIYRDFFHLFPRWCGHEQNFAPSVNSFLSSLDVEFQMDRGGIYVNK